MPFNNVPWLEKVKFGILFSITIPSVICSILIFIYFYQKRSNISIHHHVTLVLIIGSFLQMLTNFPFMMIYYVNGKVVPESDSFCILWNWWEYSINTLLIFVMAWTSIERHLLVFNRTIMITSRRRFFFHLLPMLIGCLYPLIFYLAVIVLNTCTNKWNYNMVSILI